MAATAHRAGPMVLAGRRRDEVDGTGEQSFDDFVRREQAGLVGLATLLTGSRATGEDIVQDVLIKVLPKWDELRPGTPARLAYLRRAVANEHLSWRRRWSTRHIRYLAPAELPDAGSAAAELPPVHDAELWRRLQQLPGQQRAAVVLRYYKDLTDAEIADVLSCREGTVRGHISRGLAALRAQPEASAAPAVPASQRRQR